MSAGYYYNLEIHFETVIPLNWSITGSSKELFTISQLLEFGPIKYIEH